MERCFEKHTTLVRQTILSVKDGDDIQICTTKDRPSGITRLGSKLEGETDITRARCDSKGPYCQYALEATMMGHEVIAKMEAGKHRGPNTHTNTGVIQQKAVMERERHGDAVWG